MLNTQQPVKYIHLENGDLEINSLTFGLREFPPFMGGRNVAVNLYGCHRQCPNCLANYTARSELLSPAAIHSRILDIMDSRLAHLPRNMDTVTLSGGEPLRQNIAPLTEHLMGFGFRVVVETAGDLWVPGLKDLALEPLFYLVISPKGLQLHPETAKHAKCFVYPVRHSSINPTNGLPLRVLGNKVTPDYNTGNAQIFVVPEWGLDDQENRLNTLAAMESCLKFGYTFANPFSMKE